jgi:hypothetical protein
MHPARVVPIPLQILERYEALRGLLFTLAWRLPGSASTRSATFTALEFGNSFTRSRSKTTTFAPLASLDKYLPRTPRKKSYSGLMSSTSGFLHSSLATGCPPCINDTYSSTTIRVRNNHETPFRRHANE